MCVCIYVYIYIYIYACVGGCVSCHIIWLNEWTKNQTIELMSQTKTKNRWWKQTNEQTYEWFNGLTNIYYKWQYMVTIFLCCMHRQTAGIVFIFLTRRPLWKVTKLPSFKMTIISQEQWITTLITHIQISFPQNHTVCLQEKYSVSNLKGQSNYFSKINSSTQWKCLLCKLHSMHLQLISWQGLR